MLQSDFFSLDGKIMIHSIMFTGINSRGLELQRPLCNGHYHQPAVQFGQISLSFCLNACLDILNILIYLAFVKSSCTLMKSKSTRLPLIVSLQ